MSNAAAVVHVFLDDAERSVSPEDVREWLQIIDEVAEMKLQYDAASKRTCYSVEFRKPASAQQAVQYLNGSRFKNCVVTIRSRFYSAVTTEATTAGSSASSQGTGASDGQVSDRTAGLRKRCRETEALPNNHLLPVDLQMDQLLVEHLEEASTGDSGEALSALWTELKGHQERLVAVYKELEVTAAELSAADSKLSRQLNPAAAETPLTPQDGSDRNVPAGGSSPAAPSASPPACPLVARHCLSHQRGIPWDAHTPVGVASFLTQRYGPLSLCTISTHQREFFVTVRFVFTADEERFLGATSSATAGAGETRTAMERTVRQLNWGAVALNVAPTSAAFLPAELQAQQATLQTLLA